MATELTKQPAKDEQIATYERLYSTAWDQGFREMMFLMAEQYSRELLVELNGQDAPSPIMKFWRESLKDLSPLQMREGLRGYMASERRSFKPTPADIKENALDTPGGDKPRLVINSNCPDCCGSGWKPVPGTYNTTTRCHCPKVVYAGQEYPWGAQKEKLLKKAE